ncbi:TB2/DP1, HVA22 family-domain-containing protein [Russula earlei]|uniref:TB2/DP1, HVA22 family-domain-containing protein n=1 Tax=Russula earlei TaxID=71964 RepID=A0ACC0UND9_9AGAM|nr:TB2/DP1, HVA22 family-domain-containing protein [Russula earlei]
MLVFVFSRLLAAWFTFLLPSYKTFKALKKSTSHEREIEKWASYWVVIAIIAAFEHTAEWLLCWFSFYWELKTLALLFLSLPQFEGSTYVYKTYVEPYLVQNEPDIDAGIASARDETLQFLQSRLSALWEILYSLLSKTPVVTKHTSPSSPFQEGAPTNGSSPVHQKAFHSALDLWGALTQSAFLGGSAPGGGKSAESRASFDSALSPAATHYGASGPVGYDVGAETVNN